MKEHSIKASDAQFIRLFRWIAGLQISSDAKLLFARLLDLADGDQNVKASRRFLRSWLSWSDARLRRASSELEKLGWLRRKASVTPAGDCAATEWTLPRIVIQTSETVRLEGVSCTGHGVPRKDTVSRTGQSRPHKQNTQEGGSRAHARTQSGARLGHVFSDCPRLSGFRSKDALAKFKPNLLRLVGRKKPLEAQRSSPSSAVTTPIWAGPSRGVRNGSISRTKYLRWMIPNTKSPARKEGCSANKCNGFANPCNTRARHRKVNQPQIACDGPCRLAITQLLFSLLALAIFQFSIPQSPHFHLWKP